jgi:hypothetical protein
MDIYIYTHTHTNTQIRVNTHDLSDLKYLFNKI